MYVYKPSWMWAICIHHISSLSAPGLVGWNKGPHFLQKEPPSRIFGLRAWVPYKYHFISYVYWENLFASNFMHSYLLHKLQYIHLELRYFWWKATLNICDWICNNHSVESIKIAIFFQMCSIITYYLLMLAQ